MDVFLKLVGLIALLVVGSALTLWLAFISPPLAALALLALTGLALGAMWWLAREQRRGEAS